jgi:hypothetical protein
MRVDVEGFCLSWTTTALAADLTVTRGPDRPQPQEIRFRFVVDAPYRRVRVNMGNRSINISTQPGVLTDALAGTDSHELLVPGSRHAVIGAWVSDLAERTGAWHAATLEEVSLEMVLGGAAFPMLGASVVTWLAGTI